MNNIQQKNVINRLISNSELPYTDKFYANHSTANFNIDANDVNHSMQMLLDNDLYIERALNATSAYVEGPKINNDTTIRSKPNGYKVYGDVATGDCLDILQKVEKPLSASLVKSSVFSDDVCFACEFENALFVGGSQSLKFTMDINADEWQTVDGDITATNYCIEDGKLFFAATTGVYQLSTYVDYNIDEFGQNPHYGEKSFSLVKLNSSDELNNVTAIDFNVKKDKLFIAATQNGKQHIYVGSYNRGTSLAQKQENIGFQKLQLFKDDKTVNLRYPSTSTNPFVNQIGHNTKNDERLLTTNGVYVEDIRNQLLNRTDMSLLDEWGDLIVKCICKNTSTNIIYIGTNHGLYSIDGMAPDEINRIFVDELDNEVEIDCIQFDKQTNTVWIASHTSSSTTLHCIKDAVIHNVSAQSCNWQFNGLQIKQIAIYEGYGIAIAHSCTEETVTDIRIFSFLLQQHTYFTSLDGVKTTLANSNGKIVDMCVYKGKLVIAQSKMLSVFSMTPSIVDSDAIQSFQLDAAMNNTVGPYKFRKIIELPKGVFIGITANDVSYIDNHNIKHSTPNVFDVVASMIGNTQCIVCIMPSRVDILSLQNSQMTLLKSFSTSSSTPFLGITPSQHAVLFNDTSKLYWVDKKSNINNIQLHHIDGLSLSGITSVENTAYILSGDTDNRNVYQLAYTLPSTTGGGDSSSQLSIYDIVYDYDLNAMLIATDNGISAISSNVSINSDGNEEQQFEYKRLISNGQSRQLDIVTSQLGNKTLFAKLSDGTVKSYMFNSSKIQEYSTSITASVWPSLTNTNFKLIGNGSKPAADPINCIAKGHIGENDYLLASTNDGIYIPVGANTQSNKYTQQTTFVGKYSYTNSIDDDASFGKIHIHNGTKTLESDESTSKLVASDISVDTIKSIIGGMANYFIRNNDTNDCYEHYCSYDESNVKTKTIRRISSGIVDGISYDVKRFEDASETLNVKLSDPSSGETVDGSIRYYKYPDVTYFIKTDNNIYIKDKDDVDIEAGATIDDVDDFDYVHSTTLSKATASDVDISRYGDVKSIDIQYKASPLIVIALHDSGSNRNTFVFGKVAYASNYQFDSNNMYAVDDNYGNPKSYEVNKAYFTSNNQIAVDYIKPGGSHEITLLNVNEMQVVNATNTAEKHFQVQLQFSGVAYNNAKQLIKCENEELFYMCAVHNGNKLTTIPNNQDVCELEDGEQINQILAELHEPSNIATKGYQYAVYIATSKREIKSILDETSLSYHEMYGFGASCLHQYDDILVMASDGILYTIINPQLNSERHAISPNLGITRCHVNVDDYGNIVVSASSSDKLYKRSLSYQSFRNYVDDGSVVITDQDYVMSINSGATIENILHAYDDDIQKLFFDVDSDEFPLLTTSSGGVHQKGVTYPSGHASYSIDWSTIKCENAIQILNAFGQLACVAEKTTGDGYQLKLISSSTLDINLEDYPIKVVPTNRFIFIETQVLGNAQWKYLADGRDSFVDIFDCPSIYSEFIKNNIHYICCSNGITTIQFIKKLDISTQAPICNTIDVIQIDNKTNAKMPIIFTDESHNLKFGYFDLNENELHQSNIYCTVPIKFKYAYEDDGKTTKLSSSTVVVDSNLELSSCWIVGNNNNSRIYGQLDASAQSVIQTCAEEFVGDSALADTEVTCDMQLMQFVCQLNPYEQNALLKSTPIPNVENVELGTSFFNDGKRTYMFDNVDIVTFTGFGVVESFEYEPTTGGCNCYSMLRDDSYSSLLIASDQYLFNDNESQINILRSISGTAIAKAQFDPNLRYVLAHTLDGNVLSSNNGKLWKKTFNINGNNYIINHILPYDSKTYIFSTTDGLYYTKYQYDMVQDVKAFSQDDALDMYDQMMNMPGTGICAQVCAVLSTHIDESHLSTSIVSKLNSEYLTNQLEDIDTTWQKTNDYTDDLYVKNDIIQEMVFGTYIDGDVLVQAKNFLSTDENDLPINVDIESSTYIMKRWMSGITELYINVPTTNTYYLPNQFGASNCKGSDSTTYERKNLIEFGEDISTQDSTISTHYTEVVVGIASSEYSIDNMLDIQVNGNSLPLKIYKDTASSRSTANQMYRSFVEPSVCTRYNVRSTNEDGYFTFNFACFGSDAQAIRLMFYDRKSRSNLPYIKVVFDSNGGSGTMSKQKFLIGPDGMLERKNLKLNKFTGDDDGRFFNGWTLQPYPDNYVWESEEYDGTQLYDDKSMFPFNEEIDDVIAELQRDLHEDPFQKKEELTLYASWITYKFTTDDTRLVLDSNKSDFYISDVEIDTTTRLKDNVVINFGD